MLYITTSAVVFKRNHLTVFKRNHLTVVAAAKQNQIKSFFFSLYYAEGVQGVCGAQATQLLSAAVASLWHHYLHLKTTADVRRLRKANKIIKKQFKGSALCDK